MMKRFTCICKDVVWKNVLKNIGGEITDGILLKGDAQKIKVITGGEITCPRSVDWKRNKICNLATIIGNRPGWLKCFDDGSN
jgi:hypothetical protein